MKFFIQLVIVIQSATVAFLLLRYDPDAHYAADAQRTTSVVLGGMLDSCHRLIEPGGRVAPRQVDDSASATSGRA